jgi:ADP-ribose pyrophosphatase
MQGADGQLRDDVFAAEVIAREKVFEGRVWDVVRDEIDYGGTRIVREYVDHTGAVAVLAMDERERVLVIKQYRHPVRRRDWEIPAGLLDKEGEPPLASAQRELAEEADLVAEEWSVLAEFYTTPGGSNEAIRIYLARGVREAPEAFARTDEEADIEKRWVPLDELVEAVLARQVQNPSLVIATLAARAARDEGWSTLADADTPWDANPRSGIGAAGTARDSAAGTVPPRPGAGPVGR